MAMKEEVSVQGWYLLQQPQQHDDDNDCYVRRECLTYEQGMANVRRLQRMGRGYLAHASKLKAYLDQRVERGELTPTEKGQQHEQ